MITDRKEYNVDFSSQDMVQYDYKIANPAIVFEILCTKLYDNPLLVAVQEYICNARDAHREADNADIPIRIVLPTTFHPVLSIIDFGTGMSPELIEKVFIVLGESTKNMSDLFTGGFGVGAKSGWAYTDTFTVKTNFDGVHYVYLAYIGEGGCGKLDLVHSEKTDQPNGTTIEITIKTSDFQKVEDYVFRTTQFWDVRPVIINVTRNRYFDDKQFDFFDETGKRIASTITTHDYRYLNNTNGQINMVIDGIIYNDICELGELPINSKLDIRTNNAVFLHYDVSELRPSINRKSVMITPGTVETAHNKLKKLISTINKDIEDGLGKATTIAELHSAINLLTESNKLFMVTAWDTTFNGYTMKYRAMNGFSFNVPGDYFIIQKYSYDRYKGTLRYQNTVSSIGINWLHDGAVIINDKYTKTVNKVSIKQYLQDNQLKEVMIIQPDLQTQYKDDIIANTTNFVDFINNHAMLLSDIEKKYDFRYSSTGRGKVIPVRLAEQSGKHKNFNLLETMEDYDYVVLDWVPVTKWWGQSIASILKRYNRINDVRFLYISATESAKKKVDKFAETDDRIIGPDQAFDIMYDYLLTKVNINNCLQQVTEDFRIDSDRMSAVQMLSDRLSDIMDQKVRSAFSKVMAFQSKYYDLRERRASDNVSDLAAIIYRIKNQDKKLTQSIDFKATILNNLIKRKQRILSKEIEDVFEKYPLLPMTYNARRLPKEEFIKYINVFYQCHQTTQQEKTA